MGTVPFQHSGKHRVKLPGGAPTPPMLSKLLFVGLSDVGQVDVLDQAPGSLIASISVPGIRVVSAYFRQ